MKYQPILDKVLIKVDPREKCFDQGGLIARPDVAEEMPYTGTVVAKGAGRIAKKTGKRIPMQVQVGDRVLIPWATGTEITFGGVYHREVAEDQILGFCDD